MPDSDEIIASHLKDLERIADHLSLILPTDYCEKICEHWFNVIAPDKTEEYGVTCWKRFGVRGIVGVLSSCYHRWERMISKSNYIDHPPMFDAIVDSFGYSVLMACCFTNYFPYFSGDFGLPRAYNEIILEKAWFNDPILGDTEVVDLSLLMAWNMYRLTI